MKLGILSTFPPEKCGVAIYTHNLVTELSKISGLEIIRIGTLGSDSHYKLSLTSFDLRSRLKKIIVREGIDIMHVQHNYPHFSRILNMNLTQCFSLPVPFIVTLHEVQYPQKLNLKQKIRQYVINEIEKNIVRKATRVIVHTPMQKSFLEKKYKAHNIQNIFHGLRFIPENNRKDHDILFLGIITPSKGINYLIEAAGQLKEFNFIIAGDTPDSIKDYKNELLGLIEKKGIGNITTDFRWLSEDEKWNYLKKADIVVLPYTWAPYQSGVLHDALSCGIPVVVTKVGALWELVERFHFGEIARPGDSSALAQSIKLVSANYASYKNGISEYRKLANWARIASEHMDLYRNVVDRTKS